MKLIALALGLVLEHVATELLHLRELRWFDKYFDYGLAQAEKVGPWGTYVVLVLVVAVPTVPVFLVSMALQGPEILWDFAYLVFAVLIVFLCLGPRDLGNEVDDYCAALDSEDLDTARSVLREMSESDRPRGNESDVVEDSIFIQANNRIFGVVFWFMVLGPVGAWLFRVSDLLRRRATFESIRDTQIVAADVLPAIEAIYGLLKWFPARLAMLGYMLSGSFDDALNGYRSYEAIAGTPIDRRNDDLVARVGRAAMTGSLDEPSNSSAAARNSMRLVKRTLFIWVTVIALMTIFGWAI
jgi:membrane protein required for beta-lactamase induction